MMKVLVGFSFGYQPVKLMEEKEPFVGFEPVPKFLPSSQAQVG